MGKNGYIEFQNKDSQLELVLHMPADGGKQVTIEEVIYCLDKQKLNYRDMVSLAKFIQAGADGSVLQLGPAITPFNAWCEYQISSDWMSVKAKHYAGCVGMDDISIEEIKKDLQQLKVVYGIQENQLRCLVDKDHYMEEIEIARGTAPVEGTDAVLQYCFDINKELKPSINEDGTVDYRNLDGLNHIKEGDVVATITPCVLGTPGKNVQGVELPPQRVKTVNFKFGKNMVIREDGLALIAATSGHVCLEGDKIFLSNVLEVVNVDNSTGNIVYDGDVLITGNVLAGFSVKTSGNIQVRGIVEGAVLEAGGDITLFRGVQGMNKAKICAGGNIVTRFIESAESILAEGNIEADTLLHSKVSAKGHIRVAGKNGLIIGGDVRSAHGIRARVIGNEMGTATMVGAGVDPSLRKEMEQLKQDIVKENENRAKVCQIVMTLQKLQQSGAVLDPAKQELLQKTARNIMMIDSHIKEMRGRLNELTELLVDDADARISVEKCAYAGTRIMFGEASLYLKENESRCQYVKKGAEIVRLAF